MNHPETVPTQTTSVPELDFELLLSLARNDPERYTDMRLALVNLTISCLETKNGQLAELQRTIDQVTGRDAPPDQAMLDIARLLSERISTLGALTQRLKQELGSHPPPSSRPSAR